MAGKPRKQLRFKFEAAWIFKGEDKVKKPQSLRSYPEQVRDEMVPTTSGVIVKVFEVTAKSTVRLVGGTRRNGLTALKAVRRAVRA